MCRPRSVTPFLLHTGRPPLVEAEGQDERLDQDMRRAVDVSVRNGPPVHLLGSPSRPCHCHPHSVTPVRYTPYRSIVSLSR